jgi:hypothetical protein
MFFTVLVALGMFLGSSPTVWAYEEAPVLEGGIIAGKVTILGKPSPKGFNLVTFPDPAYCGRISTGTGWRILQDFGIGRDGSFKDVVVMLSEVPWGKPFRFTPPTIEARDCQFLPFVSIVRGQQNVRVVNMDPVMHDVQAYETSHLGPRVLFNSPLPMNPNHRSDVGPHSHQHLPGKAIDEAIHLTKDRRVFVMQCGFHAYLYGKLGTRGNASVLRCYGCRWDVHHRRRTARRVYDHRVAPSRRCIGAEDYRRGQWNDPRGFSVQRAHRSA